MKIIIKLIKSKNKTYINFLYKKYAHMLVALGDHIVQKNFRYLPIEKEDLYNIVLDVCSNLWKINEETIQKYGVKKILQMQMVQRIIAFNRKHNNNGNRILNNYIQVSEEQNIDEFTLEEFNFDSTNLELILDRNKEKINKFSEITQLIFNEYFIKNNSRKDISLKYKLPLKLVNSKVEYLKKFMNKNFIK